jgi:methyl-accepting chemotaxis protein
MSHRSARSLMGKLVVSFVSVAMVLIAVVGYLSYTSARGALEAAQFEKLDSVRDAQARYVQTYVADTVDQVRLLLKRPNLHAALVSLSWSYDDERTASAREGRSEDSSDGQRKIFGSKGSYDIVEKNFSAFLEVQSSADGYEDIIYVHAADGRVLYTNKRLSDFGAHLKTGPLKDSGLGKAYQAVLRDLKPVMVTFTMYEPAAGPACFVAAPVAMQDAGKCIGVLALRLSPNKINEMMRLSQSAGKTAEAYVVDRDRLMLSDSRFQTESTVLKHRVDTEPVRLALQDETGHMVTKDYRGEPVFSSYTLIPLDRIKEFVPEVKWALIAEIGERQAVQPAVDLGRRVIGSAILVSMVMALVGFLIARTISRPVSTLADAVTQVSAGDLNVEIPMQDRGDELGVLAKAIRGMVTSLRDQIRQTLEGVTVLAASANEISTTVSQLATSTARTSSAVAQTTTTVEEVRQAAKMASEKARQVAENAQKSVIVSESGKTATEDTIHRMNLIKEQMESIGETVVKLSEHSRAIENIIVSVQDLADQSNLLAVNASIEAARAGDQGKGFAVVAQEIKTLADQSRQATEQARSILGDTRRWVSAVVMATELGGKAVDAGVSQSTLAGESIRSLAQDVSGSSQAATVIHSSSEQQVAGVEQVARAMAHIAEAMSQNMAGASQLETAARRLEELGSSLQAVVQRYKL